VNQAEVLSAFERSDAIRTGHFKLSSGLHSDTYLQCALVLQHPGISERLGHELGTRLAEHEPSVVLGPAMGGVIIAHETARFLGVRALFAERVDGALALRRGFALDPGDRVVVVEDVVTTGRSPREAIDLAKEAGAEVVAVGAIVDRSSDASFGVPFEWLARVDAHSWAPETCPLCASGDEPTSPGSRHLVR